MNGSSRAEALALVLTLAVVGAFLVSAATGIRLPVQDRPAVDPPAARAAPSGSEQPTPPSVDGPAVRVEVLNGSGRPGLARGATERLRAAGFDVVYFGNAGEPRGLSLVLDRGGNADGARRAAAALGIASVRSDPNLARMVDVTVLLGKDWPPKADTATRAQESGVRRLLRSVF